MKNKHGEDHYHPGDLIPEPWASLYFSQEKKMKITIVNKEIIKKLSVHDGVMGPIHYNYENKSCTFEVMNPCLLYTSRCV